MNYASSCGSGTVPLQQVLILTAYQVPDSLWVRGRTKLSLFPPRKLYFDR